MKPKLFLTLIISGSVIFFSCAKKVVSDFDIDEIFESYYTANYDVCRNLKRIESAKIYVSYPIEIGHMVLEDIELDRRMNARSVVNIDDEETFKNSCDMSITLKDDLADYMILLLIDAKEADKEKTKVKKIKESRETSKASLPGKMQGGMIIDINFENGDTESYIMDNDGKDLFYKKSEPDKFYKMPKVILDAFYENIKFKNPRGLVFKTFVLR